jgi:ADP-ribose pyrophosphatase YjhB (NUDIX family)
MTDNKTLIRARAVIVDNGELLVVKHAPTASYYVLPGGRFEFGEDPKTCIRRELHEELGVETESDQLVCVYSFTRGSEHSLEFFFTVKNPEKFRVPVVDRPTHAHELAEIRWITPADTIRLLPPEFHRLYQTGQLAADTPHFLVGERVV